MTDVNSIIDFIKLFGLYIFRSDSILFQANEPEACMLQEQENEWFPNCWNTSIALMNMIRKDVISTTEIDIPSNITQESFIDLYDTVFRFLQSDTTAYFWSTRSSGRAPFRCPYRSRREFNSDKWICGWSSIDIHKYNRNHSKHASSVYGWG